MLGAALGVELAGVELSCPEGPRLIGLSVPMGETLTVLVEVLVTVDVSV